MVRVREILAAGTLGELVYLTAEHGQWFADDPSFRLFAPSLGGGALLDLGIYPVSFAHMVFGAPSRITAVSDPAFTGVDRTTSAILQYDNGAHAVLTTSLAGASDNPAVDPRHRGTPRARRLVLHADVVPGRLARRRGARVVHAAAGGRGMEHEAIEVGRCLRRGLTESPLLPLDETLAVMATMDEIRAQIGLDYSTL